MYLILLTQAVPLSWPLELEEECNIEIIYQRPGWFSPLSFTDFIFQNSVGNEAYPAENEELMKNKFIQTLFFQHFWLSSLSSCLNIEFLQTVDCFLSENIK